MTGAEIRSIITKNWDNVGCTLEKEGLRVQPEQFSGWRIAVISTYFDGKSRVERKNIALKKREGLQTEWLGLNHVKT